MGSTSEYPKGGQYGMMLSSGLSHMDFQRSINGEAPLLTVNFGQFRAPVSEHQGDSAGNVRRKTQEIPI